MSKTVPDTWKVFNKYLLNKEVHSFSQDDYILLFGVVLHSGWGGGD